MFPTSGYFRAVHCPFFLSGLCERPYCHFRHSAKAEEKVANKAETGPSYSTSGPRSYQQTSAYNQGSLHPQSSYNQPDVARYSTLSPSEPTGPVETYKTASVFEIGSCTIPNFTNSDQNLPETLEDPLNLASLPKISGLPKPKQANNSLPSYVPTPKVKFQPVSLSAPTYNPTPKAISERKPSRTIEYDPVKNFAFIERRASSGEESCGEADKEKECKGHKNKHLKGGKAPLQPEGEFSEDDAPNDAKATWQDDDLTDSDEDVSGRHEKTEASIEDKLMDFAALLTPSSQITSKLKLLSEGAKIKDSRKKVNSEQSIKPGTNSNTKIVTSNSCNNQASPDSTSSTPQDSNSSESVSQKKSDVIIHRSQSSSSNSSKLKSSSERHHSKSRSLSESHSASRSSSNSSSKTSKHGSGSSESDSKAAAEHSSKSSSKSTSSQKSSSTNANCSSTKSKSSHSSSKDKKESLPSESSNSKKKHSFKEISQKLLKHTARAGSSNSEKENRHGSKSKHSDSSSSRMSSSKLSSPKASSTKTDDASLKSLKKDASKHRSLEKKTHLKVEELVKNKVKCEVATAVSSTSLTSTKSRSSSCDSKSDLAHPINNLLEVIVKKERRDSQENMTPHKDVNKNKTKHKSHNKDSNRQSAVSIKEEKQASKDSSQKNGKNFSDAGKYSTSAVKLEKQDSVQGIVQSSMDMKAGKVKPSGKVGPKARLIEESDGSDSDVQIIEVSDASPPQILELSDSDEEGAGQSDDGGMSEEVDMLSDSDTFDECLKIFQESERQLAAKSRKASLNPDQSKEQTVPKSFEKPENILASLSKKRMAHKSADKLRKPVKAPVLMRPKMSPAEVMHNRIVEMQKRALLRAAAREGRESELPSGLSGRSPQPPVTKSIPVSTSTPSLLASAANSVLFSSKKREAHTPKPATPTKVSSTSTSTSHLYSPNSFYSKKKATDAPKAVENPDKFVTIAGTASKTEKRKAHEPTMTNLKRPIIPGTFGDKVPSNIRQRYLNIIIDEFLKFSSEEIAFQKGQEEEQAAYARASNKNIYLGLVANAIKRIRVEASECQTPSSKKACPGLTSLSSMASLPIHVAQSHAAQLGGFHAAKTSFTLNRSGSAGKNLLKNISGKDFYEHLKKYILNEQQLRDNGYPRSAEDGSNKVVFYKENAKDSLLKDNERTCRRCGKRYYVAKDGSPTNLEKCLYHHGSAYKTRIAGSIDSRYSCCGERAGTKGCQIAEFHVNERNKTDNLSGYMKTLPSPDKDFNVYSLDCEMVYTKAGLELARVTVVGEDCETVYESLVKPDTDVIDYNTRFSGITEADMKGVTTTLRGVQAVMLSLVSDKTILMGHSLESDLVALKLIHSTVVDTSLVFPHRLGLPYKRALRNLMVEILQKIIQDSAGGHDSKEDAVACMQLMQYKIKEDAKREVRRC